MLALPPLQVARQVTLRLPLNAGIRVRNHPPLRHGIVFKASVLYRSMGQFRHVMQHDLGISMFRNDKADCVGRAVGGNAGATLGVSEIAEILQLLVGWRHGLRAGGTRPAKAGAQRQPPGKRPGDIPGLFARKKIRASHGNANLIAKWPACVRFSLL